MHKRLAERKKRIQAKRSLNTSAVREVFIREHEENKGEGAH